MSRASAPQRHSFHAIRDRRRHGSRRTVCGDPSSLALSIVVLQNSTGRDPGSLANAFADMILGPVPAPKAVPFTGDLDALTGEYSGPVRGSHQHVKVRRDGDQLVFETDREVRPIHIGDGVWATGNARVSFVVANGRAIELRRKQGSGIYVLRRILP